MYVTSSCSNMSKMWLSVNHFSMHVCIHVCPIYTDKDHIKQCKHIPFKNIHNRDAVSPITSTLSNSRKFTLYSLDMNFTISDISYKHKYMHLYSFNNIQSGHGIIPIISNLRQNTGNTQWNQAFHNSSKAIWHSACSLLSKSNKSAKNTSEEAIRASIHTQNQSSQPSIQWLKTRSDICYLQCHLSRCHSTFMYYWTHCLKDVSMCSHWSYQTC